MHVYADGCVRYIIHLRLIKNNLFFLSLNQKICIKKILEETKHVKFVY